MNAPPPPPTTTISPIDLHSLSARPAARDPTRPRVIQRKPTTPSNRHTALIDYSVLHRGRPVKRLTAGRRRQTGGRNNQGRITAWHRGSGHKRLYRIIDFARRNYAGLPGTVERVEYDPNRSGLIALLRYPVPADREGLSMAGEKRQRRKHRRARAADAAAAADPTPAAATLASEARIVYITAPPGELHAQSWLSSQTSTAAGSGSRASARPAATPPLGNSLLVLQKRNITSKRSPTHLSYILCPQGIQIGQQLLSRLDGAVDPTPGNACPLRFLPIGTRVHNIEMRPGNGGQLCRSAGTSAQLLEKDERRSLALLRLQSKEVRYVHWNCMATVGAVSNPEHQNQSLGKAGRNRWRHRRPHTRGVAMNPVDHPHGGGEGKTSGGRPSVTPWGKPTKGYRTVRKPRGARFILRRRFKIK
ncbi:hypothetical protein CDCA_CDCA07G2048 [Cyanidium caldarium]|uniref:Large ribosomal subunit protein uL2m n=1 Tax=Cyanidium caldarium TaxID=2771 RepID=A0AAV9IUQ2_CYACA|nr:hypothetical protein CDCA_CDCA07G2048 [Cyanidium caldarium]